MIPVAPDDLLRSGPLLLFAMAVAETAVPLGLVVPAGVALATGVFLAHQGLLPWALVLSASCLGALVGDSLGFWLGRKGSPLLRRTPGFVGRLAAPAAARAGILFRDHPLVAVTGGRLVAFVRTLMPATAGASGMTYLRFVAFDIPGVAAWALLYMAIGLGAGEGWGLIVEGSGPGLLPLALLIVAVALWAGRRLRRRTRRARALAGEEG